MRTFGRWPRIFRLQDVAMLSNVLNNAMLFLQRGELAFNTPKPHRAGQDGSKACRLRVREAEKRTRINANEFDEETGKASEDQIIAKNLAFGLRLLQGFFSH